MILEIKFYLYLQPQLSSYGWKVMDMNSRVVVVAVVIKGFWYHVIEAETLWGSTRFCRLGYFEPVSLRFLSSFFLHPRFLLSTPPLVQNSESLMTSFLLELTGLQASNTTSTEEVHDYGKQPELGWQNVAIASTFILINGKQPHICRVVVCCVESRVPCVHRIHFFIDIRHYVVTAWFKAWKVINHCSHSMSCTAHYHGKSHLRFYQIRLSYRLVLGIHLGRRV